MNNKKQHFLLEDYMKTLVYTTIHEITNSLSLVTGFHEDIVDDFNERGEVIIKDIVELHLLGKGVKKLEATINDFRENNYFSGKKEPIKVHEFCDTIIESCRHAFTRGEPKFVTECLTESLDVERAKFFMLVKLAIIHFSTEENSLNISLKNQNLSIQSELSFPYEQLALLYKSLDWKDSFRIMLSENSISIDVL